MKSGCRYGYYNVTVQVLTNNVEELNLRAWMLVERYMKLSLGSHEVVAPYFTNDVGRMFGRLMNIAGLTEDEKMRIIGPYKENKMQYGHFQGKATPEQLEKSFGEIAKAEDVDMGSFTAAGAREYMILKGLGVDCSGFAYNIYSQLLGADKLKSILDWRHAYEPYFAKAYTFAGKASVLVGVDDLRPLDMLLFRKADMSDYFHIALLLKDAGGWKVVQSTSAVTPMGVNISQLEMVNGKPKFSFEPARGKRYEELFEQKRLEFRRLKLLLE